MGQAESPVSIGLPVYNGARYLVEAVDCIRKQTFVDFELIICDNASTDGTAAIAHEAARDDERIRVWRSPTNAGASANYNHAFELAHGRFFKWASHDDRILPTYLERCVDEFSRSSEDVALVYPRTTLIDDSGRTTGLFDDGLDLRQKSGSARLWAYARNWRMANAVMGLIRSDLLRRTGRIRPYPTSDLVLLAELALLGSFHELDEPLFERRIHDGSATQGSRPASELDVWFSTTAPSSSRMTPMLRFLTGTNAALLTNRSVSRTSRLAGASTFTAGWAFKRSKVRAGKLRRDLRGGGWRTHRSPST